MAKYLGIPISLLDGTSDSTVTASGTSGSISVYEDYLLDLTANVFDNVQVGDTVVNTVTMAQATVTDIDFVSSGILIISSDIFLVVSQGYSITRSLTLFDATVNVFDDVQVGDVVVNTVTMAQATVTDIASAGSGALTISNDVFSVTPQGYSIFASNDDTRGNVLMSIENYIVAINVSGSLSVNFSSGYSADSQSYLPIGTPVSDSFLTKLYLRWMEKLTTTNSTNNRLDIPLNEFYNNSSHVPYYIKTITLI